MKWNSNALLLTRCIALAYTFLTATLALILTSCGFIIESITDLNSQPGKQFELLNVPVQPVYLAATDSYLKAEGSCQGYQVIEFTYSSSLTASNTILGKCSSNLISINLPVLQGDKAQVFSVKIIGYLSDPTTTQTLPPNLTVQYNPPTKLMAGFGITSGGGPTAGVSVSTLDSSIGELATGTQTAPSVTNRNGLQGALDP